MFSKTRRVTFALCVVVFAGIVLSGAVYAQATREGLREHPALSATSADIDSSGKTYVVLYWAKAEGAVGYNLYRRDESAASYPTTPLNGGKPIASVKTCDELKAFIPEGSAEWQMLANAFSAAAMQNQPQPKTPPIQIKKSPVPQPVQIIPAKKVLSSLATIGKLRPDLILFALNPCDPIERGLTAEEEALFDVMANSNLKIRLARGLGYIDSTVVANTTYVYELRGVGANGTETVIARDVKVQAGHYTLPDPPSGISATAGDSKVLVLWDRNQSAYSYAVERSTSAGGTYQQVNSEPILYDIIKDLNGDKITTPGSPRPGLVDYRRWTDDGLPTTHDVVTSTGATISVDGPANYTTYYYRVASVDILGRQGGWSRTPQQATPVDKTPPRAPEDFKVNASSAPVGLAASWRKVTLDINGHQETDTTQTYNIYRADNLDALDNTAALVPSSGYFVHSMTANPTAMSTVTLSWTDSSPVLVQPYGEKDFYYRVQCVDAHGNPGSFSAAVSARVPDTTPPGPTKVIGADGHADHIRAYWEPNTEPDLGGYQVWVGVCDKGKPYRPPKVGTKENLPQPCDFRLAGEILVSDAKKRLADTGRIYYDDYSMGKDSPVCYAYWVRAFDMSRNLYPGKSSSGCPETGEYVCQRLYEETAPPPPIISALKARNNSVLVEWVASPIQDLRAFHIYRSAKEDDPPVFVGCVLTDGTVMSTKWPGMKPKCEDIPAEPNPTAVKGSFEDKGVEPNKVFYYRVAAVDWLGNESEAAKLTEIPAISTFTYSADPPGMPVVSPPSPAGGTGCGLVVRWTPAFDSAKYEGFLVFRGTASAGPFRQVSSALTKNEFADATALRGVDYWYRVQAMDKTGKLSQPSAAVLYKY